MTEIKRKPTTFQLDPVILEALKLRAIRKKIPMYILVEDIFISYFEKGEDA